MQNLQQGNSANEHPQGYILCGGKSRRFGEDKARYEIGGVPMISHIASLLGEWSNSVTAIADMPDKYQDLHLKTIADLHPGLGPLGGLQTALSHARTTSSNHWIVLVSCDMTTLSKDWLDTLWTQTRISTDCNAILFEELETPRLHPFPGCFHLDLLDSIEKQIAARHLSLQRLFQTVDNRIKRLKLPNDWPCVPQINTMNDADTWQASKKNKPTDSKLAIQKEKHSDE